jgi:hypothetical protein
MNPPNSSDTLRKEQHLRSARLDELLGESLHRLPVWVRPPKAGVEFYSGFSRAKLYEGAARGHFRSVSIREPGQVKGTRLFNLQSILHFIERVEAEANKVSPQIGGDSVARIGGEQTRSDEAPPRDQ